MPQPVFANYDKDGRSVSDPNFVPGKYSYVFAQAPAAPIILLGAATNITATGAITGLTALPYTPSGVVQVYCYAQTGLAAGLYYAIFSSTTACQLYLDAAGTITPTGITAGAFAGGTTLATLLTIQNLQT